MELTDLQFVAKQQDRINELERGISDICILIKNPSNFFIEHDDENLNYLAKMVVDQAIELNELRKFKNTIITSGSK